MYQPLIDFLPFLTQLAKDLLHPSPEEEKRRHKKKRLVQSPNSYFMDVKCPGIVFLHADEPHHTHISPVTGYSGY